MEWTESVKRSESGRFAETSPKIDTSGRPARLSEAQEEPAFFLITYVTRADGGGCAC
jgi:hypothetical protein